MKKFGGGKPPATYDYHGRQITIKEAAGLAGMTTEGIKYRLKKNGGSMEMAIDGGKSEAEAVDEMMAALGYGIPAPEPAVSTIPENQAAPEAAEEPQPSEPIEKDLPWKVRLKFINRAIAAMEQLAAVDLGRTELANTIIDAAYELRGVRCEMFEGYVDWEEMAK